MGGDQGGLLHPSPATTTRDRIRYITVRNTTTAHLGVLRRGQTPEERCQLINRRRQSDISKFLSKLVAKDERSDSISGEFLQTLHFLPLNLVDRILFGWFSKERDSIPIDRDEIGSPDRITTISEMLSSSYRFNGSCDFSIARRVRVEELSDII